MKVRVEEPMEAEKHTANPYHQFILFGDSITQQSSSQEKGFALAPALQWEYIRRLDVINRGFGGYTSANAVNILPHFLPPPSQARVRFLLIFFGANDAVLHNAMDNRQHVPLETYKANLSKIIHNPAVKKQNPRIILVTPPPVNEYLTNGNRVAENTKLYADAVKEVGRKENVAVLDIWSCFMKHAGWKEGEALLGSRSIPPSEILRTLLVDGLHLTGTAYTFVFQELMKLIEREFPDQMPANLPFIFPPWETKAAAKGEFQVAQQ